MIQLNLLPDVKKEFLTAQRMKRNIVSVSILVSVGAVGLVLLLAGYVHGAQRFARNQLQEDIDRYSKELKGIPDINKILTVQGALEVLPGMHDGSYVSSRYFEYLKKLVPKDVALTKLDVTQDDTSIRLSAKAKDYRALNVFADTLKAAQLTYGSDDQRQTTRAFEKVTITSAFNSSGSEKEGIEFTLAMEFDAALFSVTTVNPQIAVPNVTTGEGFVGSDALFDGEKDAGRAAQ